MAPLSHCDEGLRGPIVRGWRVRRNSRRTGGVTITHKLQFKGLGIRAAFAGLYRLWQDDQGQDIAEYAVMLAVILIIVIGTVKLIGTNANSTFSNVASSIQ